VIFVLEWPNGKFVSFWLAAFCWQNHYYVMLLLSQEMPYISESSAIQSLFLWYGNNLIMTSSSVTSCKKVISVFKEDSVQNSRQRSWIPCIHLDVPVNCPDALQSSNTRLNDVVIPSGPPSAGADPRVGWGGQFLKNNLKYTKKIIFSSQNYTFVPPK